MKEIKRSFLEIDIDDVCKDGAKNQSLDRFRDCFGNRIDVDVGAGVGVGVSERFLRKFIN